MPSHLRRRRPGHRRQVKGRLQAPAEPALLRKVRQLAELWALPVADICQTELADIAAPCVRITLARGDAASIAHIDGRLAEHGLRVRDAVPSGEAGIALDVVPAWALRRETPWERRITMRRPFA